MWRIPIWSRRLCAWWLPADTSHIVRVEDYGVYTLLGQTMDDAAGEAFDKERRACWDCRIRGGPLLDKLSREGNPHALKLPHVQTPGR